MFLGSCLARTSSLSETVAPESWRPPPRSNKVSSSVLQGSKSLAGMGLSSNELFPWTRGDLVLVCGHQIW